MMAHASLIAAFLWIGTLLCQLVLLVLQLRTYRRTRHSSLVLLAIATSSGVLYLLSGTAAGVYASKAKLFLGLYAASILTFSIQAIVGIWGSASLFGAFAAHRGPTEATLGGSVCDVPANQVTEAPSRIAELGRSGKLHSMLSLWALRRVANASELVSERSVVLLGAASMALWIGVDRLRAGRGATFNVFAIPPFCAIVLFILALAWTLGRPSRPRLGYSQSLFIIVAVLPLMIALRAAVQTVLTGPWLLLAYAFVVLYAVGYGWRALRTFTGARQPWAAILSIVLACGALRIAQSAYIYPALWLPKPSESASDFAPQPGIDEPLLFDQQRRIDAAVSQVEAGEGSRPSAFFVGFAGVAEEKVFAEEIKLAARVVDSRFGTARRQLLMINDHRDRETYPLATVSGLHYGLSAIARKMNLQRDILILSLSSHGSAQPELSVSNGAMNLDQINDQNLLQALRDSGIRWRIIFISACHAGAFIHALEDPGTIIIAAAAPDKTSFGCSDDRNLTYFGEAFYRDALPKAQSLQTAFAQAKISIANREAAEHVTPSDPQAYFGGDIVQVLKQNPMRDAGDSAY